MPAMPMPDLAVPYAAPKPVECQRREFGGDNGEVLTAEYHLHAGDGLESVHGASGDRRGAYCGSDSCLSRVSRLFSFTGAWETNHSEEWGEPRGQFRVHGDGGVATS